MARWSRCGVVAAHAALLVVSSQAHGQRLTESAAGIQRATAARTDAATPMPLLALVGLAGGGGLLGGMYGGAAGLIVDYNYCKRHHLDTVGFIFPPCTFYTGAATPIGWVAGSVIGAATTGAVIAYSHGCPKSAAVLRSFAGAAVGAAPGAILLAHRRGYSSRLRARIVTGTPFLAGAGSALAVVGCERS